MISEKLLFKFSYVCLSLEKLVNGKHFPVKGKFDLVLFVIKKVGQRKTLSGQRKI
jgi:hypothetical protein